MIPSFLCISTGIPFPLFITEIWFFSRSMVTFIWSMVSSLICHVSLAAHKQEGAETYLVVGSVDKNLVKDLEETWDKGRVTNVSSTPL